MILRASYWIDWSFQVIRFRYSGGMCLALGGKELHMQHSEGFFVLLSRGYVTIF